MKASGLVCRGLPSGRPGDCESVASTAAAAPGARRLASYQFTHSGSCYGRPGVVQAGPLWCTVITHPHGFQWDSAAAAGAAAAAGDFLPMGNHPRRCCCNVLRRLFRIMGRSIGPRLLPEMVRLHQLVERRRYRLVVRSPP